MKSSHIAKIINKLYQKAKILVPDPNFQQEIIQLRENWNIPHD